MNTIGIMGALEQEVRALVDGMEQRKVEEYGGVTYHIGRRAGRRLVVCCAGMGKANAAATTQVLITRFGAKALIFSGIAGNMSGAIGVGGVVIGQELVYHDADGDLLAMSAPGTATYTAHPLLVDAAEQGCRLVGAHYVVGRIATGDRFVGDPDTKRRIQAAFHPDCVEMEGAAVAQVAMRNDVPFVVVRAMSDECDASFEALDIAGLDTAEYVQTATAIVHAMVDALNYMEL